MKRAVQWSVLCLFVVAATGCGSGEQLDPELEKLGRASGPVSPGAQGRMGSMPPAKGGEAPSGGGAVIRGKIVETMQVPKYTYMLLDVDEGDPVWTAVNSTKVEVGQEVSVVESITMRDFHSRTLNRTFPVIVFATMGEAGAPAPVDGGLPPGHPPMDGMPPGHPPVDGQPSQPAE